MTLSIAGLQAFYLGCLSQLFHDYTGRARERWLQVFSYNRSVGVSASMALAGLGCLVPLLKEYFSSGLKLLGLADLPERLAILGMLFLIMAFANFVFTLVFHGAVFSMKTLKKRAAR